MKNHKSPTTLALQAHLNRRESILTKHHKHAFEDLPKFAGSVLLGLMTGKTVSDKKREEQRQQKRLELLGSP